MEQKDIQQLIKDTVSHAKDAFFNENSNVAHFILTKMEGHIKKTVEDTIDDKLAPVYKYIESDMARNEQKDKEDKVFKEDIAPVIQMGKNVRGFGSVSLYVLGFFASATGAFYGIMEFIKHKAQ